MTPALYDALLDLLVRRLDGLVASAELVNWATRALEEGVECDGLVFLAGLSRDSSAYEAAALLDRGIAELRLAVPAAEELRRLQRSTTARPSRALRQRLSDIPLRRPFVRSPAPPPNSASSRAGSRRGR